MKLISFPKMPNLYNLDRDEGIWLYDNVGIQEKIHGTMTRVGISKEEIVIGSRRRKLSPSNQGQKDQYDVCLDIVTRVKDNILANSKLLDFCDIMLFGEFAGPAIQKGIDYGKKRGLYIFDVVLIDKETGERNWLDVGEVDIFCKKWGLTPVPTLEVNAKPSLELFNSLYDISSQIDSTFGLDNTIEGIVIKTMPVAFDAYGDLVYVKHKNDKWSEKLPKKRLPREVPKVVQYITKARVLHGIDKLKEDDLFTRHMQDMKYLADIVTKDIIEEEKVEGKYKSVRRVVSKRVARLYKKLLLDGEV